MPPPPYLGRARLGNRLNAFRLGHFDVTAHIMVAGAARSSSILTETLVVRDVAGAQPNTASFHTTINPGWTPVRGQAVTIGLGAISNGLFSGHVESVAQKYKSTFANKYFEVTATDHTRLLNRRKVWGTYAGIDAGGAVMQVLSSHTSGFTDYSKIVWGLGVIGTHEFRGVDVTDVLDAFATDVGAIWEASQGRVRFEAVDSGVVPAVLTEAHPTARDWTYTRMIRQARTRIYVRGAKTAIAAPVSVGQTVLPVKDVARFIGGSQAECGAQILSFTGTSVSTDDTAALVAGSPLGLGAVTLSLARSASTVSVSTMTRAGAVVTVTTSGAHGFAVGLAVRIAGAVQNDYNGTFALETVPTTTTFTFLVPGSPTTPATGTITAQKVMGGPIIGAVTYKVTAVVERVSGSSTRNLESELGSASASVTGETLSPPAAVAAAEGHSASTVSVSSITRSGTTATVTTGSAHGYATGMQATIVGAVEAAYNGTVTITVTSTTVFTFSVSGSPSTPATGTITAQAVTSGPLVGAYRYRYTHVSARGETLGSAETSATATEVSVPGAATAAEAHSLSTVAVTGVTRVGTVATVTATGAHGYAAGMAVRIAGAVETQYNGTFTVATVTSTTVFTYRVTGSPSTPATGTITAQAVTSGPLIGLYGYKVSYITRTGETLQSVAASATGTEIAAPGAPTTAVSTTVDGGLAPGTYVYKVSFASASGETAPGTVSVATSPTQVTAPTALSGTASVTVDGGLPAGTYLYRVTYTTSRGETEAGTSTSNVTTTAVPTPSGSGTSTTSTTVDGGLPAGAYAYKVTYTTSRGETDANATPANATVAVVTAPSSTPSGSPTTGGSLTLDANYLYRVTYYTARGETTVSAATSTINLGPADNAVSLTSIPTSADGRVVGRKLYRTKAGGSIYYLVGTIGDNTTTTFTDQMADSSLAVLAPIANSTSGQINLTALPTSADARVIGRKVYRTLAGGSVYYLLTTLNDNTTTVYTDTSPDASLGALLPTVNTTASQIALSGIPTSADLRVSGRQIYRTKAGGSIYFLLTTLNDNTTTVFTDTTLDASLSEAAPAVNTTGGQIALSAIPTSADPRVLSRRIYRTKAGGISCFLLATLNDNSTTVYTDTAADTSLTESAPTEGQNHGAAIKLTSIAVSTDPRVTSRRIYRTSAGGSAYKILATIGDNIVTSYTDTAFDEQLGDAAPTEAVGHGAAIKLTGLAVSTDPRVMSRRIYRTVVGGTEFRLVGTIGDNISISFTDVTPDAELGGTMPATNTFGGDAVLVTAIPLGPTGTVARKLYRLGAGSAGYLYVGSIPDNLTTTFTDTRAPDELGAEAPAASQLGPVVGDVVLRVSDLSKFNSLGGWTVISGQAIRYTGRAASSGEGNLTGIPASGIGSILADLATADPIVNKGYLTGIPGSGVGSVAYALEEGAEIRLLVMVESVPAQVALATLEGGDGIHEHTIDAGQEATVSESQRAGEKELEDFDAGEDSFSWTSRDPNVRSNALQSVNIGAPHAIVGDFLIKDVTFTGFEQVYLTVNGMRIPTFPLAAAAAGRGQLTLADLMRMVQVA